MVDTRTCQHKAPTRRPRKNPQASATTTTNFRPVIQRVATDGAETILDTPGQKSCKASLKGSPSLPRSKMILHRERGGSKAGQDQHRGQQGHVDKQWKSAERNRRAWQHRHHYHRRPYRRRRSPGPLPPGSVTESFAAGVGRPGGRSPQESVAGSAVTGDGRRGDRGGNGADRGTH